MWLQSVLDNQDWSLRELARKSGVSPQTISYVLRGERGVGLDLCMGLSTALSVPLEEVLRIAGILPRLEAGTEADPTIQAVLDRLRHLTPEERNEALSLVDVVYRRKHKGP